MASDEDIKALAQIALRHKELLNLAFGIVNDCVHLVVPLLERCSHEDCKHPATVVHSAVPNIRLCDYHAAKVVVKSREGLARASEQVKEITTQLADEENWHDLPSAARIRRFAEYVTLMGHKDEASSTIVRTELH